MIEIKHKLTGEVIYRYDGDSLRGADLRGANLSDSDLRNSDLRNSDLRNSDLRNSDLRGANLRYADLRGANLSYADLSYADLRGANLRNSDLRYANLRGADLRYADLRGAHLDRVTTDQRYITIGCIGRDRRQTTYCFDTDTVWCGCFTGTLEEFAAQVEETHKYNPQHLAEYRGAITYIKSLQTSPDKSVS